MKLWIVRKHPRHPYIDRAHLSAFEIHKAFLTRQEAKAEADERQKKSSYLFTVGYVKTKEPK